MSAGSAGGEFNERDRGDVGSLSGWSCPVSIGGATHVTMAHGAGGRLTEQLIRTVFLPAFADAGDGDHPGTSEAGTWGLSVRGDAAVVGSPGGRLAVTTDSFVVRPRWFPGGSIGDLAINGTVNDLAMVGARPMYLTAGFILEEGIAIEELGRIVETMATAARAAGVKIVAGDTKVVDAGHGDGVFINTTGIGLVPGGIEIGPHRAGAGDLVLVSGPVGLHGIAVMSVRGGIEFDVEVESDTTSLYPLVESVIEPGLGVHVLRDPTRGGVAAALNEIAASSRVGVELTESSVPVPDGVRAACGFLGLDPLEVANEGCMLAIVAAEDADEVLGRWHGDPRGIDAAIIGRVVEDHPGKVLARTPMGGLRVVDMPLGEQLPRIC